jgi:guanylate kinase
MPVSEGPPPDMGARPERPRVSASPGRLIVLSGPSGVGKDTLLHELFRVAPWLHYSISYTTRPPRPGEVDGVSYHFVDEAGFQGLRDSRQLLEYANVHGHWYGTGEAAVRASLERGEDIVLKIDVQGAAWIRPRVEGAIFIFLLPPGPEELRRRLTERATESPDSLELRWENARQELAQQDLYDYRVVNDDVHRAALEILDIIERSRSREVKP